MGRSLMSYKPNEDEGNPTYFFDEAELDHLLTDGSIGAGDYIYEVNLIYKVKLKSELILEPLPGKKKG